MNIRMYSNTTLMANATANNICQIATGAIATRGSFHLVLAGGTSPRLCYQQLCQYAADWSCWHIYFGDERCVPIGDHRRNDRMADEAWLNHVGILPTHIHRMPAELGAKKGAQLYGQTLAAVPLFDCVLLGIGEDGHTASLFPDHPALQQDGAVVAVHHAPKPPADRVSLSLQRINQSRHRMIMVAGASKADVWQAIVDGGTFPVTGVEEPLWLCSGEIQNVAD